MLLQDVDGFGDACGAARAVGGVTELLKVAGAEANASESSGLDTWLAAGIATAVLLTALALGAGAWHARRRA